MVYLTNKSNKIVGAKCNPTKFKKTKALKNLKRSNAVVPNPWKIYH